MNNKFKAGDKVKFVHPHGNNRSPYYIVWKVDNLHVPAVRIILPRYEGASKKKYRHVFEKRLEFYEQV